MIQEILEKAKSADFDFRKYASPLERFQVRVQITSESDELISSLPPAPVIISYHWYEFESEIPVIFDGLRSALPLGLQQQTGTYTATVDAPARAGPFRLALTLVQEGCRWFEEAPGLRPAEKLVRISAPVSQGLV
ncbi:hypothetical protein BH20VER1_BH20VER1_17660 [soil metagenome]